MVDFAGLVTFSGCTLIKNGPSAKGTNRTLGSLLKFKKGSNKESRQRYLNIFINLVIIIISPLVLLLIAKSFVTNL